MAHQSKMTLGELISFLYEEYLDVYGDEDLASVAAAATINKLIMDANTGELLEAEAA